VFPVRYGQTYRVELTGRFTMSIIVIAILIYYHHKPTDNFTIQYLSTQTVFAKHLHDAVILIINPRILVALSNRTKLLKCFPSTFTSGCENYSFALKHSFKLR
jgi:hypothetical protein